MAFADLVRPVPETELAKVNVKIPEAEPGIRQGVAVVAGIYGRSLELSRFLNTNGFQVIGSNWALPPHENNFQFRSWPRNAFVQLNETIFTRPGVQQEVLGWSFRSFMGEAASRLKFVEHEVLGNGGKVLSANHYLVVPETGLDKQDLALIKKAGDFEIPPPRRRGCSLYEREN